MNICIATSDYFYSENGIAVFTNHLAALLTKNGHRVWILTVGYDAGLMEDDTTQNISPNLTLVVLKKTYHQYLSFYSRSFRPGGLNAPNWIAMGFSIKEWLKTNAGLYAIDIVEVSDYGGAGAFLLGKNIPPVLITGHGSLAQLITHYKFHKQDDHFNIITKLEKTAIENANGIIAHSPVNKRDLESLFLTSVCEALIPFRLSATCQDAAGTADGLLSVGSLNPVKGIYTVLDALKILKEKNYPIKLNWFGADTFTAPKGKKMSEYLPSAYPEIWNTSFIWNTKVSSEDIKSRIAAAEIIIIPAIFETFNYIALEAAELKKPIIITSQTGAASFFIHMESACIIPAGKPDELANAVIMLRENPVLRNTLGNNARETVRHIFNENNILKSRLSVYEKAVQKGKTENIADEEITSVLRNYVTVSRNIYYKLRVIAKKIAGRK